VDIKVCQSDSEFVNNADSWLQKRIAQYQARRVFLPSGGTPTPLYAKWEAERPKFLESLEFTQLDEVDSGPKKGIFAEYFRQNLPSYQKQFIALEKQMEIPDLVILGIGMNGHVAFHEPHVRTDFFRGYVNLDSDTCARMGVVDRTRGLTFGLKCFLQAKGVLLLVRGKDKKQIFNQFMQGLGDLPVTHLKAHKDFTVLVDNAAYGEPT
jgi:6-phosphogluconolactonase/glucosamine-6-phosphate isomerase/deaminase